MAYSDDFRWRIVSLIHMYGLDTDFLSDLFGPTEWSILRWYVLFKQKGVVSDQKDADRRSRWPEHVKRDEKKLLRKIRHFTWTNYNSF